MFPLLPSFRIIVESGKQMSWDSELEDFKSKIDLREYAAGQGYTLDRRESWSGSAVMRNGGDKVVIKVNSNGHHIYFSVRDERDNGTIVDFVQFRKRLSLGEVRKGCAAVDRAGTHFPAPFREARKNREGPPTR